MIALSQFWFMALVTGSMAIGVLIGLMFEGLWG